jgi:ADP-heptose:LPS heptosyltransferase
MRLFTELTRALPFFRSHAYERAVVRLAAGPVGSTIGERGLAAIRRVRSLRRALIVADTNLGDAVLLQPSIAALHHRFPTCHVDYAFNRKMARLIGPDPAIHTAHPVFSGGDGSRAADLEALREVLRRGRYDLVVNFCPFFTGRDLGSAGVSVIHPLGFAIELLRAHREGGVASMAYRAMAWTDRLTAECAGAALARTSPTPFAGTRVFVRTSAARRARRLLDGRGPAVFVNPDTSNHSTFLGVDLHVELIRRLVETDLVGALVLGRGFTFRRVEDEILERLPAALRDRVVPCPDRLDLEDLAALVDSCRLYIGGDTGPLHIAAARKVDPEVRHRFANRTAVIGVFKASDPRIYGYDSDRAEMIGSSQQAPAITVEGLPPCKNLTCSLQRISASCAAVACQKALTAEAVALAAITLLAAEASDRAAAHSAAVAV